MTRRRMALFLSLLLILSSCLTIGTANARVEYKQAPMLDSVEGLPPVAERLPKEPKLTNEMPEDQLKYEIGTYGGTLRTVTSVVDWDADVFVMNDEPLLNTPGILGNEITGNVLKGYEVTDDQQEFTFFMREGLRWSDGEPVTSEDVRFTVEDVIKNEELTPVIAKWMKSGDSATGTPFDFELVDEYTFKIKFDKPYGGFPMHITINGWKGYTDLLKPAHYLKQFHKDYIDDLSVLKPYAEKFNIADDERMWAGVFAKVDIPIWDLTRTRAIGFPTLCPWMLTSVENGVYTFDRNPYYFKVDAEGNQLPYIDKIESTYVQDMEMVGMKIIGGEVDFARESASLVKMPLYRENEKNGYVALVRDMHVTPTDFFFNRTYDDPIWREVASDVRFRKAMSLAIDREEIIDAVYYGFADVGLFQDPTYDPEAAGALLDEMGMKIGADGFRTAPDGSPFSFVYEVAAQAPDIVPMSELLVQFWTDIGINVTMKTVNTTMWGNKVNANEIQATMIWTHTPLWYAQDWYLNGWGRMWEIWRSGAKTTTQTDEQGNVTEIEAKGEEPPEDVKEFINMIDSLLVTSPAEALETFAKLKESMNENYWYIVPLGNVKQAMIANAKLGNVPESGVAIACNFSGEQFFFRAE